MVLQTFLFVLFGKGRTVSLETFKKETNKQGELGGNAGVKAAAATLWWQSKR